MTSCHFCGKLYDNPYYCNVVLVLVLADTDKDLPEVGNSHQHTYSQHLFDELREEGRS